jgi:YVTN family beta-propeller protein
MRLRRAMFRSSAMSVLALAAACASDRSTGLAANVFLRGTSTNHQIGLVVNSTGRSLTLFQLGAPTQTRQVPLGASSAITPVGLSVRGGTATIPLGDAASVALVDLNALAITRYFLFRSGNSTGSAYADDTTVFADNTANGYVGRFSIHQLSDTIADTVRVAPAPTDIQVAAARILVISANLDANFNPLGNGVVTAIDPKTLAVLGTVSTTGANSTAGAIGPDGNLYVVNTGDYVNPGSLTVIDPATLAVIRTVPNVGLGPGAIAIDRNGLAYISSFSAGTVIWDTNTQAFVRDPIHPVCAPISAGCRGAFDARPDTTGNLYQVFFGSAAQSLSPYVFVFQRRNYTLIDSIAVGQGPAALRIVEF